MAEPATGTSPTTSDNIGDVLASIRRLIAQDEANRSVTDPGQRLRQVAQQQAELRRASQAAAAPEKAAPPEAPLMLGDHEMVAARPPFRQPALSMPRMRPVSDEQIFSDQATGGPVPLRPLEPAAPPTSAAHTQPAVPAPAQAPVAPPVTPVAAGNAPSFLHRPLPAEPTARPASAADLPLAAPPEGVAPLAAGAQPETYPPELSGQDVLPDDVLPEDDFHLFVLPDEDSPTEVLLRNLIREAIRGELQGELGGQFSRNLRRVIRSEVELALRQIRRTP